jgi:hypothetical protein
MTAPTRPRLTAPSTAPDLVRFTGLVLMGALVLVWAELLLTAQGEHPNTGTGAVVDTAIMVAAGAAGLGLAVARLRSPRLAEIGSLVGTLVFLVPFWCGGAIVLGALAFRLNRGPRPMLAWIAAAIAAVQGVMLVASMVFAYGPGLPVT